MSATACKHGQQASKIGCMTRLDKKLGHSVCKGRSQHAKMLQIQGVAVIFAQPENTGFRMSREVELALRQASQERVIVAMQDPSQGQLALFDNNDLPY